MSFLNDFLLANSYLCSPSSDLLRERVAPGRALVRLGDGLLGEDGLAGPQAAADVILVGKGGRGDQARVHRRVLERCGGRRGVEERHVAEVVGLPVSMS